MPEAAPGKQSFPAGVAKQELRDEKTARSILFFPKAGVLS
jgi:hypothetical protein